jgi:7-cyano-7-deazaguanine synthase
MTVMAKKVIVLHSGGLDSTTCLLLALEQSADVLSLGIDYGQANRTELEYALQQCHRFKVPRKILRVEWDKPKREIPLGRTVEIIKQGVSSAFLPGRNALFLILACAEGSGIGAEEVWIGINSIDYSGYPDCRPDFLDAFRNMLKIAIPNGPRIVAPLMSLSKPEIAKEAYRLGLSPGETWSCYRPVQTSSGVKACGCCDACILHKYAWDHARDVS